MGIKKSTVKKLININQDVSFLERQIELLKAQEDQLLDDFEERIEAIAKMICKIYDVSFVGLNMNNDYIRHCNNESYLAVSIIYAIQPNINEWKNSDYCKYGYPIRFLHMDDKEIELEILESKNKRL